MAEEAIPGVGTWGEQMEMVAWVILMEEMVLTLRALHMNDPVKLHSRQLPQEVNRTCGVVVPATARHGESPPVTIGQGRNGAFLLPTTMTSPHPHLVNPSRRCIPLPLLLQRNMAVVILRRLHRLHTARRPLMIDPAK